MLKIRPRILKYHHYNDVMSDNPLIIVGASARAAAFSAYRAGYTPYWLDQFGDEDLRQRFPGNVIPDYPQAAVELIAGAPDAPFLVTGAMENHPGVLEQLCAQRKLLGNPKPVCSKVRDPSILYEALRRNRVSCPEVRTVERGRISSMPPHVVSGGSSPNRHDWLMKPLRSAGGIGTRRYHGQPVDARYYLQEYLRGDSFSAVFIGARGHCRLLGVTRQLVGLPEFHAGEFSYCGSIGPIELNDTEKEQWCRIGEALAGEFELKGLFGVDAIKRQNSIYPVEVNPRYTASVEVLELALGCHAVKYHYDAGNNQALTVEERTPCHKVGKAILFAPEDLVFTGCDQGGVTIADIPAPGTAIEQGQPILTTIVEATGSDSIDSIMHSLKRAASSIYESLGVAL